MPTALARKARSPRNLVHDTMYRRGRAAIARTVHRVDDVLSSMRGDHRRILFEAATPMSLAVFAPVLRVLRSDPRLEFWFCSFSQTDALAPAFASLSGIGHVINAQQAAWMKFDAYVNTDFWDMTWLHRRARRIHFFHGVAGKYGLDAPVTIAPLVASFDRLMFANTDRLERYINAGIIEAGSPQAALVGYPKVDCLVDGSLDRAYTEDVIGLDPDRPTVLYAPTWSPYSSLHVMGPEIVAALAQLDVNVVVKLHDRSLDGSERGAGGVDWLALLERLCASPRVHFAAGSDASPYLHAADVLVTDHSSVAFEFTLLDRPLIVVDCPQLVEKARVNPEKAALLRGAADRIQRVDELASAVRHALDDPGEHSEARRDIARSLFYQPGTATDRAVAVFYDLLGLSPDSRPSEAIPPAAGGSLSSGEDFHA